MRLLYLFCAFLVISFEVFSQDCDITVEPSPVTCFGGSDGSAEILLDDQPLVIGDGGNNGKPFTCVTPEVSPYSCSSPVQDAVFSNATDGVVVVEDGKTLYLTSADFDGNIRFKGQSTLIVCGKATIRNFEMNNSSKPVTVIINGEATAFGGTFNLDQHSTIKNYGKLNLEQNLNLMGKLFNYGTLHAKSTLNTNAGTGQIYNASIFTVEVDFNNYNQTTNGGSMLVKNRFHNNGGAGFVNLCTIETAIFHNSTYIENYGRITGLSGGDALVNLQGNSTYKAYGGSLLKASDITVDGVITGNGPECASVKVTGTTKINGSGSVQGILDFCAPYIHPDEAVRIYSPVTTDCSCPANGNGNAISGTVSWSAGTPISKGASVTDLEANSYTVTVDLEGCDQEEIIFSVSSPTRIMASVSVNNSTATVSAEGGNQGGYFYLWKNLDTQEESISSSASESFSAGEYEVRVKDSKGCISDPEPFTITGGGSECNFTLDTSSVTCFGGNDGSVTVLKDGLPLDVPGGGNSGDGPGGDTGIPEGTPGTCMEPETSPYSCSSIPTGAIIYDQNSGTVTVNSGETVFITSPSFSGDLSIGGGSLIVCGNATIQNFNFQSQVTDSFNLIINGNADLQAPNLNLLDNHTVLNFGNLETKSIGFNGSLENHGTMVVEGDLSFNTASNYYLNTGSITVNSNFNNKFLTVNGGIFDIKGTFNNNEPVSEFINHCKLLVGGALNNNKKLENRGYIIVESAKTTFNGNSTYESFPGAVIFTNEFVNNGQINGNESCSSIRVKDRTELNATSNISGYISLCDGNDFIETNNGTLVSPATLDCRCGGTSSGSTSGPITWSGNSTFLGNPLGNQTSGPGSVIINWPGCPQDTLYYDIDGPETPVTASVTVNNGTATVSNPTGGNGEPYRYIWSVSSDTVSSDSRFFAVNGNYYVSVIDAKGCGSEPIPFSISTNQDSTCGVHVEYLAGNKVLVKIECPADGVDDDNDGDSNDDDCQYLISDGAGDFLAYGDSLPRPCKDSLIISVNCKGDTIKTEVAGSGICEDCDPAVDPECPCNLALEDVCPCDPDTDENCPCDPNDPNCRNDEGGDSGLHVNAEITPTSCPGAPNVKLTVSGGSGNYNVYSPGNAFFSAGGDNPIQLYGIEPGDLFLNIIDNNNNALVLDTTIYIAKPARASLQVPTFDTGGTECKDEFNISLTDANNGPYKLFLGCCQSENAENISAVNGNLDLGPYTIPDNIGNGPFVIKVTGAACESYDDLVTKCNDTCDIQTQNFTPAISPTLPSHKGRKDGKLTVTNVPAGLKVYWTGTDLYHAVEGSTLSGIGAGYYTVLLVDKQTECIYYKGAPGDIFLPDGPEYEVTYKAVGGCQYEAVLSKTNENGNPLPVATPVTFQWYLTGTHQLVASGPQVDVELIASQYNTDYLTLVATDANQNSDDFPFKVPAKCKPVVDCGISIQYKPFDPVCHDGKSGKILITRVPEIGDFKWTTPNMPGGQTGVEQFGLGANKYKLALYHPNPQCKPQSIGIYLNNPAELVVSHEDLAGGGVRVFVSNGVAPYSYNWEGSDADTDTLLNLVPGQTYKVFVTDSKGCPGEYEFVYDPCALNKPQPFVVLEEDSAYVVSKNGVPPFSFEWLGGSIADRSLQVQKELANDDYVVVVIDKLGCQDSVAFNSFNCGETPTINIPDLSSRADLCDAKADLSLTGVIDYTDYIILWDADPLAKTLLLNSYEDLKQISSLNFTNGCPGTHQVDVITPSGCIISDKFDVDFVSGPEDPCKPDLSIQAPGGTDFARACFTDTVNIEVSVTGGTAPYRYLWLRERTGFEADTITSDKPGYDDPLPGNYTLTVFDKFDCPVSKNFSVSGPSAILDFTQNTDAPVCYEPNGTLNLEISGGQSPYTVTWSDNSTSQSSDGLVSLEWPIAISDSFLITDAAGCEVPGDAIIEANEQSAFPGKIFYNRKEFCAGKNKVTLSAREVEDYTYTWIGVGIKAGTEYDPRIEIDTAGLVRLVYTPVSGSECTIEVEDTITIRQRPDSLCGRTGITCDIVEVRARDVTIRDICEVTIRNVDTSNVEARYYAYIEEAKKNFRFNYVNAVMDNLQEDLTIEYSDKEQHYTLYYYDQAGNLVRTVPPAGVRPLETDKVAAISEYWDKKTDKDPSNDPQSKPEIYTEHTLATTYQYNSLNQLIAQDMPDHNRQDLWEIQNVFSLSGNEYVGALDFLNNMDGLLFVNNDTETKLYTSSNGGDNWDQTTQIQFDDILDIYHKTGSNPAYFAVGKNGLILRGTDGGKEWFLHASPTTKDLISVYFKSALEGRIMASDGTIWYTSTGGQSWIINESFKDEISTISEVWNEGEVIVVAGMQGSRSVLYYSDNDGSNFTEQVFGAASYGTVYTSKDGESLITGTGGVLLKSENDRLKVQGSLGLDQYIRKLIHNESGYTALVTTGTGNAYGNIYTSTDGIAWTQQTSSSDIWVLSKIDDHTVSALTSSGYIETARDHDWQAFEKPQTLNATNAQLSDPGYLVNSQYLSGIFFSNIPLGLNQTLSNKEIMSGTTISFKKVNGTWQKIDVRYLNQTAKKVVVLGPNDWLILAGTNLYRTQLPQDTLPFTLDLANGGASVSTEIYDIYKVGSDNYALKSNPAKLVKLTANSNGTVSESDIFTLPANINTGMIASFLVESVSGNLKAFMTLNDGSVWVRQLSGAWQNESLDIQPEQLNFAVSASANTIFVGGDNGELFKKDNNYGDTWTPVALPGIVGLNSKDAYLDANELVLATDQGIKVYNTVSGTLTTENGVNGTINEISGGVAVTEEKQIFRRGGTGWTQETNPANDALTDVSGNLAAGVQQILYLDGGAWMAAPAVKVQPIADLAQGTNVIAVGKQGTILVSTDGSSWKASGVGETLDLTAVGAHGNYAVAGAANGALFKSTNGGNNWAEVSPIPGTGTVRSIDIPSSKNVWATKGNALLYSANEGAYSLKINTSSSTDELYDVAIDEDGYGFVVGDAGNAYRIQPVGSFSVDQLEYAACGTPVEATEMSGTGLAWLKICNDEDITDEVGTGLPARPLRSVQFKDRLTGYITGTGGLVLKTIDGGYHWFKEEAGNGTGTPVLAMADEENGTLVNSQGNIQNLRDRAQQTGSRFWYDELGRLTLSQNAKQYNIEDYLTSEEESEVEGDDDVSIRAYSYTLYDEIGRIVEVGELLTRNALPTAKHESQVKYEEVAAGFIDNSGIRREITRTYYDEAVFDNLYPEFEQENLRPRVASVTYQDEEGTGYDRATHYSYDIHGNVKTLIQELRVDNSELKKRLDYDYDLISGKVNYVYYQKDEPDQLIHRYAYDGDNRITEVYTSRDGIVWDRDAQYEYYAHGPLARVKIGEQEVEKMDYAYTLQGWIKSTRGENFSYSLGYHSQDYQSIGANNLLATPVAQGKDLYNGNIATMATNTPAFTESPDMTQQFGYDQLNRIKESRVISDHANSYHTNYSYDANGNIESLKRYNAGGDTLFDALVYRYESKAKGYLNNTNKLRSVDDNGVEGDFGDIKGQEVDNYSYDDIGNLISDKQEDIERIEWTVYGKIKSVNRVEGSQKPDLVFHYDASGNRISKKVIYPGGLTKITYYIRDASGNVMAVYQKQEGSSEVNLAEHHIYGSSRLGILRSYGSGQTGMVGSRVFGLKDYEISDHLGNVRVVLSDAKNEVGITEVSAAYGYYPGGMLMPGRQFSSGYRYGFNGMEKDDEIKGAGNSYTTEFRQYDPRLGRWLSLDPLMLKFPWQSPYVAFNNNPIRYSDPLGLEGEDEVAPAGHTKNVGADGSNLYLPTGATTTTFSGSTATGKTTGNSINVTKGGVNTFTIGEGDDAKTFTARFNKETGAFMNYQTKGGEVYNNPAGLESSGTVSKSAWGETQGLYPTADGKNSSGKYQPKNWDYDNSNELLKARAAINTVADRNSHLRKDSPGSGSIEKTLSVWSMTENFPTTDIEILNDKDVKYFYLSSDPNAKHTGLNYTTNDVTMVKSYGPFYNNGGGDVDAGPTYILFYKATPKKK